MTLTVVSNPPCAGSITHQPDYGGWAFYPQDNVTLQANACPGYEFVNWTGDVDAIEDTTQSTVVLAMERYYLGVPREVNLTANFVPTGEVHTVTFRANPPLGGYVVVHTCCGDFITDNTQSTVSLDLVDGTEVSLTATALKGYSFKGWSGGVSGAGDGVTLSVDSSREVTASFGKPGSFPWKWLAVGLGGGLVVAVSLGVLLYLRRARASPA